jgi:hypothetical protein
MMRLGAQLEVKDNSTTMYDVEMIGRVYHWEVLDTTDSNCLLLKNKNCADEPCLKLV